ncbi:MAG: hypothetical protein M3R06_10995, partial [Chloroflexota bacterium]|nr:hypothetical protein [Chloroflexota bacterium]
HLCKQLLCFTIRIGAGYVPLDRGRDRGGELDSPWRIQSIGREVRSKFSPVDPAPDFGLGEHQAPRRISN